VLDTGVDPHPWFTGTPWFAECGADVREVLDANHDCDLDTESGHGTFVTGVIAQQAPDATLHVARVLGSDGVCDELDLIRGLDGLRRRAQASGRPLDLVNLSLGGYTYDDRPSPLLSQALGRLGRRTVIVAAAGNNASDRPFWPAALKSCIAVGSLAASGTSRSRFSNYGWWVDACAVGEGVTSSFVDFTGRDATPDDDFAGYARWSGTSFAAPKVTGAIAAVALAKPDLEISDAADQILDHEGNRTMADLGVIVSGDASGAHPAGPK
jgi:subtilisin family serine protease